LAFAGPDPLHQSSSHIQSQPTTFRQVLASKIPAPVPRRYPAVAAMAAETTGEFGVNFAAAVSVAIHSAFAFLIAYAAALISR
jgi:hypothetical protein